jgi:hypothetical protein
VPGTVTWHGYPAVTVTEQSAPRGAESGEHDHREDPEVEEPIVREARLGTGGRQPVPAEHKRREKDEEEIPHPTRGERSRAGRC